MQEKPEAENPPKYKEHPAAAFYHATKAGRALPSEKMPRMISMPDLRPRPPKQEPPPDPSAPPTQEPPSLD